MDARANKKVMAHRALSGILAVTAVAGWSLYGYSVSSWGAAEQALQARISEIRDDRTRIAEERDRLKSQAAELQQVKAELALARSVADEPRPAAAPQEDDPIQPRLDRSSVPEQADADAAEVTGTVLSPSEIAASVKTAQLVLTELGFGPLQSDGVMGPKTRQAIESFERANGLVVTGELGPRTVQALKGAAQAAAGSTPAARAASVETQE